MHYIRESIKSFNWLPSLAKLAIRCAVDRGWRICSSLSPRPFHMCLHLWWVWHFVLGVLCEIDFISQAQFINDSASYCDVVSPSRYAPSNVLGRKLEIFTLVVCRKPLKSFLQGRIWSVNLYFPEQTTFRLEHERFMHGYPLTSTSTHEHANKHTHKHTRGQTYISKKLITESLALSLEMIANIYQFQAHRPVITWQQ